MNQVLEISNIKILNSFKTVWTIHYKLSWNKWKIKNLSEEVELFFKEATDNFRTEKYNIGIKLIGSAQ